jgi:hypothetical protein
VYYGQEQGFRGGSDPGNREPLWPSGYDNTTAAYGLLQKLNGLRNHLVATSGWAAARRVVVGGPWVAGVAIAVAAWWMW